MKAWSRRLGGFIGARELSMKGTESERDIGWEIVVVGATVG
jgi:hypothetical protein